MDSRQENKINSQGQEGQSVNVLDVFKYLLANWKWFLLSILLFGGYYLYQYSKTSFMYSQSQTVMIKTPANTPSTARFTRTNATLNTVSVASEILQLRSKELMRQTVSRLNADVSYSVKRGLRNYELYKSAPVLVSFLGEERKATMRFTAVPVDKDHVILKNWNGTDKEEELKVAFGKEVKTPAGLLRIKPTDYYSESAYGTEIMVTKHVTERVANYFLNNMTISQMEDDASLLQMRLEDQSPQRASDIITELITVYNEIALKDRNEIAVNTSAFIQERLQVIEEELGTVESSIEQLKTQNQGVDVGVAGQMYLSDSRQFQAERTKIETDKKLVEMMREYLTAESKQNELIPNNTGLVDGNVEGQIVEYNTTLLRRNRLVEGSSTANPVVKDLDQALAAMRGNIHRAIDNTLTGFDIKIANVQGEERQARGKALQIPQRQRVMLSVERQQKVKEELYIFLLNKREENALNQAMTEDNIKIVDPAFGSDAPAYPSRLKKVAMGVGIGLVLPAIILLSMMMLDTGVRSRQDVEKAITAPFLGEVPLKKAIGDKPILVSKSGRDAITEAFRIMRTNINFMAKDGLPPKVITLTSFSIGAGKTFTALNLATTASFLDKKVVVLDLDLRKGTLTNRMKLKGTTGATHYLADQSVKVDDIIEKGADNEFMDFIPIGRIAPNPVELLLSNRLDQLIAELRERYDYVIVDGVPVGIVADATIVDRISDLTLFIIRAGKMDRRELPELEKIYQTGKLSKLAIVLNGLKQGSAGYGYGSYGYGSYGGYGYGYGEEKKSLWKRMFRSS